MSSYPALIYNRNREGATTNADGRVWFANRGRLEKLMHGTAEGVGAAVTKRGSGDFNPGFIPGFTSGTATVIELSRNEPPMTPEEALRLGGLIVASWTALNSTDSIPTFCDTVFLIPEASGQ